MNDLGEFLRRTLGNVIFGIAKTATGRMAAEMAHDFRPYGIAAVSHGESRALLILPNERDKFPGSLPISGMSFGELLGHQPIFALYADEQANQHADKAQIGGKRTGGHGRTQHRKRHTRVNEMADDAVRARLHKFVLFFEGYHI